MSKAARRIVVIGAGVGGLAAALELNRRGYEVVVLERHLEVGGKAAERRECGFRWDLGPSIVVMPWVYRTLFEASGLDVDTYLPMRRLDPAFRVVLTDGRRLDIVASEDGLRETFAAIDPRDGDGLTSFLARLDRFAALIGHAYCDRILERWSQVLLSPLLVSASVVGPGQSYAREVDRHFRSPAIRELLYGFPTYSGFRPDEAPASLLVIPWTILREGVWYPESGGVAAIPRAIAAACQATGVEIRCGVEVEAIELDGTGRPRGVSTSGGFLAADLVVSNSDLVHTLRLLRGGPPFTQEVEQLRRGEATPSTSFFTVQLGCRRSWEGLAHHMLVLTKGSSRVYQELFVESQYPSDPPIYVNATSVSEPTDAPEGGSNPFVVVGAPPLPEGRGPDRDFEERYAEQLIRKLETAGFTGLGEATVTRHLTSPADWRDRFHAFQGSIYGLGVEHNVLGRSFRPLNFRPEFPGLYFVGGSVQPGPGLPMVVQSGKITAARIERDHPLPKRPVVIAR